MRKENSDGFWGYHPYYGEHKRRRCDKYRWDEIKNEENGQERQPKWEEGKIILEGSAERKRYNRYGIKCGRGPRGKLGLQKTNKKSLASKNLQQNDVEGRVARFIVSKKYDLFPDLVDEKVPKQIIWWWS